MGDTEVQLEEGVEIAPMGPVCPPRIMGNIAALVIAQPLGWVLFGLLAILDKIGIPVDSLVGVLALMNGWVFFQLMNVMCVHGIATRWLRVSLMVGLLLPNIAICLMPAMLLSGSLNSTSQTAPASDSLLLTLLTILLLICHGAATLFLVAPEKFEYIVRRLPVIGPALESIPWIFPRTDTCLESPPPGLPYNPSLKPGSATDLIGQEATLRSALRPWGKLRLHGSTYEVKSEGEFMEAGTRVRIARVEGGHIVVTPSETD